MKDHQNVLLKIVDEYYLTKNYNFVIILTYAFIMTCILFQMYAGYLPAFFAGINERMNHYNIIITCGLQIFLTIFGAWLQDRGNTKSRTAVKAEEKVEARTFAGVYSIEDFEDYYEKGLIMKRSGQLRELKETLNSEEGGNGLRWIYLTGDSGAGKSTILKILQKELQADYINREYFKLSGLVDGIIKNEKRYVFLDQFETALKYREEIEAFFSGLERAKAKVVVILSFRKEFLVDVVKILGQKPTHIVVQDEQDKKDMIGMISENYQRSEKTDLKRIMEEDLACLSGESRIIRILMKAVQEESLPMIAFEIVGTILEQKINLEDFIQEDLPPDQFIDSVINFYFKQTLSLDDKHKIIALGILYLLSKDKLLAARFSIEDFKNITFANEKEIREVLDFLIGNKFVKEVNRTEYEISHDYIAGKVLYFVSAETVNADIVKNIDYYFHYIYMEKYDVHKNGIMDRIKKRYRIFTDRKNEGFTLVTMLLTCFLSALLFALSFQGGTGSLENHEKIIITLLVGLSVFYVYNFFMNFIKMFPYFWVPESACIAVISLIFYHMNLWIVCLGLGVTVIGLSHAFILRPIDKSARKYLKKNCILFSCFGLVIVLVGIFDLIFQFESSFRYFWYLFYFLYIMGAIMGHITPDYFAIRIGKANALKVVGQR